MNLTRAATVDQRRRAPDAPAAAPSRPDPMATWKRDSYFAEMPKEAPAWRQLLPWGGLVVALLVGLVCYFIYAPRIQPFLTA
jgi:hypothetical protein